MARSARLLDTTIRDFSGGWNTADNDINLNSKFQVVSVNADRGIDGSLVGRQGTKLFVNFDDGTETAVASASYTCATVDTNPYITITQVGHSFSDGDHITISGVASAFNGIPAADINRTHGVLVVDADNFKIACRSAATSTASSSISFAYTRDTHTVGGNILYTKYFNRRNVVFTDIGEVGTVDINGNIAVIWNYSLADTLTSGLIPCRECNHWSASAFKSTLIACNGYTKDKPIQIDSSFNVTFLYDKATLSSAHVPKADFVICTKGYVVFMRTEYGDPFLEMSAKATDGTFTREASPADAVEVDLSMVSSSVEPTILGGGVIRDRLYVAFYDIAMLGQLGLYNGSLHDPDFDDVVAEHGTISHNTIVSLGNDILSCDYAGVLSITLSQASGSYIPVRLSELIKPDLSRHLGNLSEDTLRRKSFAVLNKNLKSYMLFLPIYDEVAITTIADPLRFYETMRDNNYVVITLPDHRLFEDSSITIAGATDVGDLSASNINGVRRVIRVLSKDAVLVQIGGYPSSSLDSFGGGSSLTITPVNDETIVYSFEYNKEFRSRRWTMYRGWNFKAATTSQRGKMFLCSDRKMYVMGDYDEPIYADFVGDYDQASWATSTAYSVGDRVLDTNTVYVCLEDHTSAASGTFANDRAANLDYWEVYAGEPIHGIVESPWSDMRNHARNKVNKYINLDVKGDAQFTVSAFVNKIYIDGSTGELATVRSMDMTADETGGFGGSSPQSFGSGRRTKEQKVWPFEFRGKLIRWRYEWNTTKRIQIVSHTMYYTLGSI